MVPISRNRKRKKGRIVEVDRKALKIQIMLAREGPIEVF